MSICWDCYWGWSEPVAEIYKRAVKALGGNYDPLHFGPAHIVWEDENFSDGDIRWCLKYLKENRNQYDYTDEELAIVKQSLEEMLSLSQEDRDPEPEDYDGEHPENFPPKVRTVHCCWGRDLP